MRAKNKKKKIINRPKPKIKVMNTEPTGMKLSDFESVTKGAVDMVDGIVLLASGLFRIVAFSIATAFDGLMMLFKDKKKKETQYSTVAEMRGMKLQKKQKKKEKVSIW